MACGAVSPDTRVGVSQGLSSLDEMSLENTFRKSGLYIFKVFMLHIFFIVVPCILITSKFLFLPTNAPFINHMKC